MGDDGSDESQDDAEALFEDPKGVCVVVLFFEGVDGVTKGSDVSDGSIGSEGLEVLGDVLDGGVQLFPNISSLRV